MMFRRKNPKQADYHQPLKKTSVQRVPTEAAAQPEYSLWPLQKELTRFSRAEPAAPALFPFRRQGLIRSPQGINARSRGSCRPSRLSPGAATAPASPHGSRRQGTDGPGTASCRSKESAGWGSGGCPGTLREFPLFSPAAPPDQPPLLCSLSSHTLPLEKSREISDFFPCSSRRGVSVQKENFKKRKRKLAIFHRVHAVKSPHDNAADLRNRYFSR